MRNRLYGNKQINCEKGYFSPFWRIHADVIVYIFAHLHTALRIEVSMLHMN